MTSLMKISIAIIIMAIMVSNSFAQENTKKYDHKIGPGFDHIELYDKDSEERIEVFPQSDSTLAYIAKQGEKWVAVIGDSIGGEYDKIEQLRAYDKHYHYFAQKGKKWIVVSDGVESIEFDRLFEYMPKYDYSTERFAYAGKVNGKWTVYINDLPESGYDKILEWSISFSDDGTRYAYAAQKDGDWYVIVNGVPGPAFKEIQLMSNDGLFTNWDQKIVYAGKRDKWHLVLENEIGPEHENILHWNIDAQYESPYVGENTFSIHPNSGRKAYRITNKNSTKFHAVIDGEISPEYKMNLRPIFFSHDGEHHSYVAEQTSWSQGWLSDKWKMSYDKAYMISDGVMGEQYKRITNPRFLPGDTLPTYGAAKGNKFWLFSNGNVSEEYEGWIEGSPYYNENIDVDVPGSQRIACGVKKDGDWYALIDGELSVSYDQIYKIVFSPDGKRYAYAAKRDKREFVVSNGMPGMDYKEVFNPFFNETGNLMVYQAKVDKKQLWVINETPNPIFTNIYKIQFSRENDHYIYWAQNELKWVAVCDGIPSQEYDEGFGIPQISPDGEHYAYAVKIGDKYSVVIDGEIGPEFSSLYSPQMSPDGSIVVYGAVHEGKWCMVTVEL